MKTIVLLMAVSFLAAGPAVAGGSGVSIGNGVSRPPVDFSHALGRRGTSIGNGMGTPELALVGTRGGITVPLDAAGRGVWKIPASITQTTLNQDIAAFVNVLVGSGKITALRVGHLVFFGGQDGGG